jgi:hypothetical protein
VTVLARARGTVQRGNSGTISRISSRQYFGKYDIDWIDKETFEKRQAQAAAAGAAANPETGIFGFVSQLVRRVVGVLASLPRTIVMGAAAIAQVALAALLKALKIPAGDFFKFVESVAGLISEVASHPIRSFKTLFDGFTSGLKMFGEDLPKNFGSAALGFVLGKIENLNLPKLPDSPSVEDLIEGLLKWLEVTLPQIRGKLAKKLGPYGEQIVTAIEKAPQGLDQVFKWFGEKDLSKAILGLLSEAADRIPNKAFFKVDELYKKVLDEGGEVVSKAVTNTLVPKLLEKVFLSLVPGGGALVAVKGVYTGIKYVFEHGGDLATLGLKLLEAAKEVATADPTKVAEKVVVLLKDLVKQALEVFATVTGLGNIPEAVGKALKGVQGWVGGKVDILIVWLAGLLGLNLASSKPCPMQETKPQPGKSAGNGPDAGTDCQKIPKGNRWLFTFKTISGIRVVDTAIARITRAEITSKRLGLLGPGTKADTAAQRWVQMIGVGPTDLPDMHVDHAGHVIARELGGHGELRTEPLNIFPQNPVSNTDPTRPWRKRENDIANEFRGGKCPTVCVKVELRYDEKAQRFVARPVKIVQNTWVNGDKWAQILVDNPINNP